MSILFSRLDNNSLNHTLNKFSLNLMVEVLHCDHVNNGEDSPYVRHGQVAPSR
jgi:hypothetical protein